ncbi:MAG: sensor histidine kinase [Vicinamibacterales bacterium]
MSDPQPEQLAAIAGEIARLSAENARLLERLADGERRFRLVSKGVLRVQEAERGGIARDLHDGVGQALTALKIDLEVLEQQAARTGSELGPRLASLKALADRTLHDVRRLSHRLRPHMLDDLGLVPTLRWLARSFADQLGIDVSVEAIGVGEPLDPDLESLVYRVAQEALTNVARHADASAVDVRIERRANHLVLSVADRGRGFDVSPAGDAPAAGFGLTGMRDRVRLFGGRFSLDSRPGRGTTIHVEVPLRAEAEPRR